MVKGVNKKIIEINHPDSLYFERAVFYLKPGITPQQLSHSDAHALIQEASPAKPKGHSWLVTGAMMLFSCVLTAVLCLVFR